MKYLLMGLLAVMAMSCQRPNCRDVAKVVEIGGCNADGYCGVLLDDGTKRSAYLPVVGLPMRSCVYE